MLGLKAHFEETGFLVLFLNFKQTYSPPNETKNTTINYTIIIIYYCFWKVHNNIVFRKETMYERNEPEAATLIILVCGWTSSLIGL